MLYVIRHLISVLLLPTTMVVIVPVWIARRYGVQARWPSAAADGALAAMGVVVLGVGLVLFAASLWQFFSHGRGTLAPWDPPRRLVVHGPYRYVRNPMISGVIFMLFGLAMGLRSRPHGVWAATFLAINAIYIPLLEEPMLEARFGAEYQRYCRHVRRLIPRLTAWNER